jgi:RimJ/RimL family protein N-acetyltransferase
VGARQLGIERLELFVEPWNEGSWRAAERVGFARGELVRRAEVIGDEPREVLVYTLRREDRRP